MIRTIANILWHVPFLGFINALYAFLLGLLLTALVITAPIGLGLIQYAKFLLFPFTRRMVPVSATGAGQNPLWAAYSAIIMLLYLPFGLFAFIVGLVQCIGLAMTIVGLPGAYIIAKSLGTYFNPVGKICVPI
ncbi:Membrane protein-like protein [uncultured delta proteobacterium]|uniref:Membrane protein-like protein n=1 Tax=uncultured delta proteobacterium TaxID=34034 RepID=A0A212IUU4_9DELT|nr:Membrane protein-like protein [uncultured delta proteobacterium]